MAKRRARNVAKAAKRPIVLKPRAAKTRAAGNRPVKPAKKGMSAASKKRKESQRRKEIVLEILEQIKGAGPAKAQKAETAVKKGKAKKGETIMPLAAAEPHIESALISRPLPSKTPPQKPSPAVFGPALSKERVSLKQVQLIKTGVPGFDEMCGGGVEEKSIALINGDAGSGKTIFGLQFLYEGAKNGEAGLYISFGEPREALYPRMMEFGMDFQELEDKQLFFFVEYQPHEVAKIISEEGGTIYDIITAYKVKRVAVDTITPYLMQFNDAYSARLALVRFFSVFRKFNVTTVLLNEWSAHIPANPSAAVAEFLADGVVYLIHSRTNDGVQVRGVEIWKMVGVDHTEVARPFAFTKKGITIYPNERLFVSHDVRIRR